MKFVVALILVMAILLQISFKEAQLKNERVKVAYQSKEDVVRKYFSNRKLNYEGFQLFIQVFKKEQRLDVYCKERGKDSFKLLTTYDICTSSGILGPKRKEGDLQVPEGIYHIEHFNPLSNFHLSLGINYPNAADKIKSDKKHPGGNIYIHGNCVTIGCIPITDDKIEELYILSVEARNSGQKNIPVYIFPDRLDNGVPEKLKTEFQVDQKVYLFWKNLQPIYLAFKSSKQVQKVKVNSAGEYFIE